MQRLQVLGSRIPRLNDGLGSCFENRMQTSFPSANRTCVPSSEVSVSGYTTSRRTEADERKLDQVLQDSFPASDPPPWTLGRANPEPAFWAVITVSARDESVIRDERVWCGYTTDVVIAGDRRTIRQRMATGIGGAGVALLIPIGILAVGLPVTLAVRALIEVARWLAAGSFNVGL